MLRKEDLRSAGLCPRLAALGILAALTAGGHHQHHPVTLFGRLADHPAAGDALVIGMGVEGNHRGHGADATRPAGQPAAVCTKRLCRAGRRAAAPGAYPGSGPGAR